MSWLPQTIHKTIVDTLAILDVTQQEQSEVIDQFEQALIVEFLSALFKKLPPQEREPIAKLLQEHSTNRKILQEKLLFWLNKDELKRLFTKVAEKQLKDFLYHAYQEATEDQKVALDQKLSP